MSEPVVFVFDPANIERLFNQDAIGQDYGAWPNSYRRRDFERMSDDELHAMITGTRNALMLPLCDGFLDGIAEVRVEAEDVARHRVLRREKARRARRTDERPAWADADLTAEVEAVAGAGRRVGGEVWMKCPWHEDKTPSLHVDPTAKIWHSFCCNRGGGVLAWREAVRSGFGRR